MTLYYLVNVASLVFIEIAGLEQGFEVALKNRKWRPQFVGNVSDEIPSDFVGGISLLTFPTNCGRHFRFFMAKSETLLEPGDLDEDNKRHIYEVMKRHSGPTQPTPP